jgi:hypothetical protein
MFRLKTFREYFDQRISEEEQVHNMDHNEALKWVLSALGIMKNPNPEDKSQRDQIDDVISSPLSAYPEKLKSLGQQLQLKYADNWPRIAALIGSPENTTVSKLVSVLSANSRPDKSITEPARTTDDDEEDDHEYTEPDGNQPL